MQQQILRRGVRLSVSPFRAFRVHGIITWLRDAVTALGRGAGRGSREEKVALLALSLVLAFLTWP